MNDFHPTSAVMEQKRLPKIMKINRFFSILALVIMGVLPLLFIPKVFITADHGKILILFGALLAVIVSGVFTLRHAQTYHVRLHPGMGAAATVALATVAAAWATPQPINTLIDPVFSPQTVAAVLIAVLASAVVFTVSSQSKNSAIFLVVLTACLSVLTTVAALAIAFQPSVIVAITLTAVATAGGWNTVAILALLFLFILCVALVTIVKTAWHTSIVILQLLFALGVLLATNVSVLWIFCFIGLLFFAMYAQNARHSISLLAQSAIYTVLVVAAMMTFFGSTLIAALPATLQVSYAEVYPSWKSTTALIQNVAQTEPVTGVGPTYLFSAWDQWKDPLIYQTDYWNTEFSTAASYISTSVIETGILGFLAWLGLIIVLFWTTRKIYQSPSSDATERCVILSAVVGVWYLFAVLLFLNVPVSIVVLFFVFVGLVSSLQSRRSDTTTLIVTMPERGRMKLIHSVGMISVLILSVLATVFIARHTIAFASANSVLNTETDPKQIEQALVQSYNLYSHPALARALATIELQQMRSVLVVEPTEEDIEIFTDTASKATSAITIALQQETRNVRYYHTQLEILIALTQAGYGGQYNDIVLETIAQAEQLSPQHPVTALLKAEYELAIADSEAAKQTLSTLLQVRSHLPAYDLALQISLAEGNSEEAIEVLSQAVAAFPNSIEVLYDAARVLAALEQWSDAKILLDRILVLQPTHADARYTLAVLAASQDDTTTALELLENLLAENPGNAVLIQTIETVKAGEFVPVQASSTDVVLEDETNTAFTDSDILTSPNRVIEEGVESQELQ